jgi:hypothetical protein
VDAEKNRKISRSVDLDDVEMPTLGTGGDERRVSAMAISPQFAR